MDGSASNRRSRCFCFRHPQLLAAGTPETRSVAHIPAQPLSLLEPAAGDRLIWERVRVVGEATNSPAMQAQRKGIPVKAANLPEGRLTQD